MIRVLVIDDSFFVRKVLEKVLFTDGEIEVVGEASNGAEGFEKIKELEPDVVCLDIVMPHQDGVFVLEKIFNFHPVPVAVVSSVSTPVSEITMNLLELGMIEVVQKPDSPEKFPVLAQELIRKIKSVAKLKKDDLSAAYLAAIKAPTTDPAEKILLIGCPSSPVRLEEFLAGMPKLMTAGIVIRLFMNQQLVDHWINRVKRSTMLSGKVAEDGDMIIPGRMLFAPHDKAIEIKELARGGVVRLVNADKMEKGFIDTMFGSAARAFRKNTVAVILSEMTRDGVQGLRAVKKTGGRSFVEDIPGLPKEILDEHLAGAVLPLEAISGEVSKLISVP